MAVDRGVRHGMLAADPWFWRRPRAMIAVAAGLFAGVFVLRLTVGGPTDAISMLFAMPIALVAVAFGLRAGLLSGLVGTGLVAVWVVVDDVSMSPVGWASRVTPLLLLGGLLGHAVDQLRLAEDERRQLDVAARRQRDAIEINDTIVQGLSAAKWSLEAGNMQGGLAIIEDTLRQGHQLVSELLRDADMGLVVHKRDETPG
jgi:hypothetical protein